MPDLHSSSQKYIVILRAPSLASLSSCSLPSTFFLVIWTQNLLESLQLILHKVHYLLLKHLEL
ncbi:hypothetical protein AALO_G00303920 [Alosa alosa]|uniref:Uncharacterized protein n=1 Tax=Alosa alosa TaxID=278164 RepID=A0AAV6FF22_9TELE|nr:hypothetical protein AALO_G00303920 [Alosa alosa]